MMARKNPPISFEKMLTELESLVGQLEHGELALEEALQRFEYGVALVRNCQSILQQAEQKVEKLIVHNGQLKPVPFDSIVD